MAPSARPNKNGLCLDEDEYYGVNKGDRKVGASELELRCCVHCKSLAIRRSCYKVFTQESCLVLLQTRKPLVEKKRRARINESLQELRTMLTETDVSLAHLLRTLPCAVQRLGSLNPNVYRIIQHMKRNPCLLLVLTASVQDGERRGSGDDSEESGTHSEKSYAR